jgi:hypothetical protein
MKILMTSMMALGVLGTLATSQPAKADISNDSNFLLVARDVGGKRGVDVGRQGHHPVAAGVVVGKAVKNNNPPQ